MRVTVLFLAIFALLNLQGADFRPPAGNRFAVHTAAGTILPGGRILRPYGIQLETGPGPLGLAVNKRGIAATADSGFERYGVTILNPPEKGSPWGEHHIWARTPGSREPETADPSWKGVSTGVAFESDSLLWVSEGASGKLRQIDIRSGDRGRTLSLNDKEWHNSFSGALAYDAPRGILYAADVANSRIVTIDRHRGHVLASLHTGLFPIAQTLSPDGRTLWEVNAGLFAYRDLAQPLSFPPFGYPSPQSQTLGPADSKDSESVCAIDVADPARPTVIECIHLGGAPSAIVATGERVYVSRSHADSLTVISAATHKVTGEISLAIPSLENYRGVMPEGLAFDPVKQWLLVAEAGINAVGVVDTAKNEVIGHIPVEWMPDQIAISGDRVYVANFLGHGTGPRLRASPLMFGEPPLLHHGSVTTFILPEEKDILDLTRTVFSSSGLVPDMRDAPALPQPIQHVVLILKESHSYDDLVGDITRAANGPVASLVPFARFGLHGRAIGAPGQFSVQDAAISPNHHALATQWAIGDSFYASGDTAAEGHRWIADLMPDLRTETAIAATGESIPPFFSLSPQPEDFTASESLWGHLEKHGVTFRNFGEGLDLAGSAGGQYSKNVPLPDALFRNTSREYPGRNTAVSDRERAGLFIAELEARYHRDNQPLPQFLVLYLPGDAPALPNREKGFPYEASYVADNDLALGRVVEYLSHSPWWPNMTIFVTEASAESGLDHIDSHRTLLLAAGPYVKRNYVSHLNSNFPGLLKTIFELLRIPPLNLHDATAAQLQDLFTTTPDLTGYKAQNPDLRILPNEGK